MAFLNVAVMEAQNIICKVVDAKTQEAIVGAVVTQKSSKKSIGYHGHRRQVRTVFLL